MKQAYTNNKEALIAVSQSEKLYFRPSIKSGIGGSEQHPNKLLNNHSNKNLFGYYESYVSINFLLVLKAKPIQI